MRKAGIFRRPDRGSRALTNGRILFIAKVAKDAGDVGRKRLEWPLRQVSGGLRDHAGIERGGLSQGETLERRRPGRFLRSAGRPALTPHAKRGRDPAKDQLQNLSALDHESDLAGALLRRNFKKTLMCDLYSR